MTPLFKTIEKLSQLGVVRHFLYLFICILYGTVALTSFGFDDEFFNIALVEKHGVGVYGVTQSGDVHPPLSYILNALLYETLGDWSLVRLVSAVSLCISMIYLSEAMRTRIGDSRATLTFLLLAFNPALLLWGTSIRWYAYFIPVLIWLLIVPRGRPIFPWIKLAVGLTVLGFIGYTAFLVAPALFVLYWISTHQQTVDKIKYIAIAFSISFSIYFHQLFVFMDVHLAGRESQVGSILMNFAGIFIAQLSNQGVFPISFFGVSSILGSLILLYVYARSNSPFKFQKNERFLSYALLLITMIVSGVASKFRNLVIATPFSAAFFGSIRFESRFKKLFYFGVLLIITSNLFGLYNVFARQGTTKNSWNLPVTEAFHLIKSEGINCGGDKIVFVHDPTLSFQLSRDGSSEKTQTFGPYLTDIALKDDYKCVFVVMTFPGSIGLDQYRRMLASVDELRHSGRTVFELQEDPYYEYKRMLDVRYPRYTVTIVKLTDVFNVEAMASWALN